jgi:hypothetical protein
MCDSYTVIANWLTPLYVEANIENGANPKVSHAALFLHLLAAYSRSNWSSAGGSGLRMGLAKRQAKNSAIERTEMMMIAIINPRMLKMNGLAKFPVEAEVLWEPIRRVISVEKHKPPTASALNARFLWPYQAEIPTRVIAKAENVSQTLSGASIAAEDCRISSSLLVKRS